MSEQEKSSIKSMNIALLERARLENGKFFTVVNVGDPRNSIVTSLSGDVSIVLTKEDMRNMINIADAYPEATVSNINKIKTGWPKHPINLYKVDNSTVDSILFDSNDHDERESIICFSNSPFVSNLIEQEVYKHNAQFSYLNESLNASTLDLADSLEAALILLSEPAESNSNDNISEIVQSSEPHFKV